MVFDRKEYMKEYDKKYYQEHKQKIKKDKKKYREKNKKEIARKKQIYYQKNKEELKRKSEEFLQRSGVKEHRKERRQEPNAKKRKRVYDQEHDQTSKRKESKKKRSQTPKAKKWRNNYCKDRRKSDPCFRFTGYVRTRICFYINKILKTGKIVYNKNNIKEIKELKKKCGIDVKAIIKHLQPLSKNPSKRYENHHIKPLYTFKLKNEDGSINLKEFKKAFAPKNNILVTKEEHKELHKKRKKTKK